MSKQTPRIYVLVTSKNNNNCQFDFNSSTCLYVLQRAVHYKLPYPMLFGRLWCLANKHEATTLMLCSRAGILLLERPAETDGRFINAGRAASGAGNGTPQRDFPQPRASCLHQGWRYFSAAKVSCERVEEDNVTTSAFTVSCIGKGENFICSYRNQLFISSCRFRKSIHSHSFYVSNCLGNWNEIDEYLSSAIISLFSHFLNLFQKWASHIRFGLHWGGGVVSRGRRQ